MKTSRILCGWANLGGGNDIAPAALEAMLGAEGIARPAHALELPGASRIAAGPTAAWTDYDAAAQCAVAILGRPRWGDRATATLANDRGHATAAMARYRAHGDRMLADLFGSFALVLIDFAQGRVVLAVDRTGVERMCFARVGPLLVFSTSARAVARHPAVGARVSRQALYDYLYCHMVPSPGTAFAGVEKLLPAQQLVATPHHATRSFYWAMRFEPAATASANGQQESFRDLLRQSVRRQIDERPTGAFLSGGTDSSTVTGLLGEISGRPARTFSIGFDAEGFDELEYARVTARHFRAEAREFYVTPEHVAEAVPLIASAYDEPFGNASAVPTYFCARLARQHGVEVMLAGDGGDEFFGGNVRYAKQGIFEHYQALGPALRRLIEPVVLNFPRGASLPPVRKAQSYVRQARIPLPDRLETYNFLHRDPLHEILEPEFLAAVDTGRPLDLMRDAYSRTESEDPVDRMMHLDHKFTLADNDLRKVGRVCELAGIDVRYPFLDDDLVEFSGTLRVAQKVSGNRLRVFFKDALRDFLPGETIAKSKHGFGLPFGLWLGTSEPLQTQARQALGRLGERGIVRPDYLQRLWREHSSSHATYYGVMIWVLTQLELWLQQNDRAQGR
ncbi:asparagine synthetase B family protein [Aromatoleum anaerobium]|uniref:asparagine synthase (glutamine-hydrolyzing) n=1 Tax=Aromatoleum anaerobium TaxID=182180 RepID=A0ABX1PH11_9RHOO|nr:asparagine synthase C-terminal domain-containing protein [Aromatoleum anaerobium]MCK0509217.1 asparagine synthase-related protein [Aromatoleum anaerobium]